jgi:hypothetical protein
MRSQFQHQSMGKLRKGAGSYQSSQSPIR